MAFCAGVQLKRDPLPPAPRSGRSARLHPLVSAGCGGAGSNHIGAVVRHQSTAGRARRDYVSRLAVDRHRLITYEAAGEILGVSVEAVREMVLSGRLRGIVRGGPRVFAAEVKTRVEAG